MKYSVITIFPELIHSYTSESLLGKAQEKDVIEVHTHDPREFATDAHKTVDDRPFGGGPGMVLKAEPILQSVEKVLKDKGEHFKILIFTPGGVQFSEAYAQDAADSLEHLILISGRYEGIDMRVKMALEDAYGTDAVEEVSVGPYVLTGGELPALVVIDAVSRFVPGVLGNDESPEAYREEVASSVMYTRPETLEWKGREYTAPEVLRSGNHAEIEKWKKEQRKKHQS